MSKTNRTARTVKEGKASPNAGAAPNSRAVEPKLTIDDLVTALADAKKWENAHEHLKDYHALHARLLCKLFGCDIEKRKGEPNDIKHRRLDVALERSTSGNRRLAIEAAYEINGSATVCLLNDCLHLLSQSLSPFRQGIKLEGMPPKIERDLWDAYSQRIDAAEREMMQLYRAVAREVLEFLFPGILGKTFPAGRLMKMGLPRIAPDPDEYF